MKPCVAAPPPCTRTRGALTAHTLPPPLVPTALAPPRTRSQLRCEACRLSSTRRRAALTHSPHSQLVTRLHDYAALGWHRALDGLPDEVAEVGARAKDRAARQVHGTGWLPQPPAPLDQASSALASVPLTARRVGDLVLSCVSVGLWELGCRLFERAERARFPQRDAALGGYLTCCRNARRFDAGWAAFVRAVHGSREPSAARLRALIGMCDRAGACPSPPPAQPSPHTHASGRQRPVTALAPAQRGWWPRSRWGRAARATRRGRRG